VRTDKTGIMRKHLYVSFTYKRKQLTFMTEVISTRISDNLAKDLEEIEREEMTDRATVIRKLLKRAIELWKKERSLRLYQEGKITLWRAARLAGVTLREMMEQAAEKEIQFKYTEKDLEEDIEAALKE